MRFYFSLALIAVAFSVASAVTPQELADYVAAVTKNSRPAAKDALTDFAELVTESNFASLGFASLEEVKDAELGQPLPVAMVRLDELQKYKDGDDPYALVHPSHRVVYPVLVKGQVRSGIELHEKDGKWLATTFGLANSVKLYAQARQKHADQPGNTPYFLVKALALNEFYLAHLKGKELRLIRVRDQAASEHKLEGHSAAQLFVELAKKAKEHDGSNR
jgi:hypothetical protein